MGFDEELSEEGLEHLERQDKDWVQSFAKGISALATAITYLFVEARIADADTKEFNVSSSRRWLAVTKYIVKQEKTIHLSINC